MKSSSRAIRLAALSGVLLLGQAQTNAVGGALHMSLFGAPRIAQAAPRPALAASPSSAAPGQRINLRGSGFRPHEKVVLYWDNTQLAGSDTANGSGALDRSFAIVPITTRSGRHALKAHGTSSGVTITTVISIPNPTLRDVPRTALTGQRFTIRASGFGAGELVAFYWDKERLPKWVVRASAQGAFKGAYGHVPGNMSKGVHTLRAKGERTKRAASVKITIALAPLPPSPTKAPVPPTAVPPTAVAHTATPVPATPVPATVTPSMNAIVAENNLPGSSDWRITHPTASGHVIEGFAARTSVNLGGIVNFYINTTPASTYTMDIYRMGWYHGAGARLTMHIANVNGIAQPTCPVVDTSLHLVSCAWSKPYAITIPTSWRSGVYLVKLTRADGYESYINIVVRDDSSNSPLLFQTSVNTYQAYNSYGGTSLYGGGDDTSNPTNRAYAVSFDRPYSRGYGAGDFLYWEYPMVQWLEQNGYDVTYQTDLDTATSSGSLLHHKAFLSVGHDEYWSRSMYDAMQAARDHGVSLGFFGANTGYWQVRYQDSSLGSNRVIICYKDKTLDPLYNHQNDLVTVKWRDPLLNRPEDGLVGQMFSSWFKPPYAAMKFTNTSAWPFAGTNLHDGDTLPNLVGYEYDKVYQDASTPPGVTILAASPVVNVNGQSDVSNVTVYKASSGAHVFSAGTIQWSWGLENDNINAGDDSWSIHSAANPAVQRLTYNVLFSFING